MKIGLFTPAWPGGNTANGITTAVSFLAEGLEANDHQITIIPMSDDGSVDERIVPLPAARRPTLVERIKSTLSIDEPIHAITAQRIAEAAQQAIRDRGIEVLIIEETHGWAADVQRLLPIPVIVALHGPWFIQTSLQSGPVSAADRRRLRREADAFRTCAGIASPSQDVLDRTQKTVKGLARMKRVIPNAINLKTPVNLSKLDARQSRSALFVGRFDHRKGADIVLTAFAKLIAQGVDAHLTFVGPDTGMAQVDGTVTHINEALAALSEDARQRIDYLGQQDKDAIDALRLQHAITINASRHESFSYTVLEALACGSPTISSAAGGPSEIIKDGETGVLVQPANATELADACFALLNDPTAAAAIGQAARVDVEKRYLPAQVAAQMAAFAQDVIAVHNRS